MRDINLFDSWAAIRYSDQANGQLCSEEEPDY